MGWQPADFGTVPIVQPPDAVAFAREVDRADVGAIHVFSGMGAYPRITAALSHAIRRGLHVGVFSESLSGITWRGPIRNLRTRWAALRWGRSLEFLLTTGELGVRWFCDRGFEPGRVFNFGYFIDRPDVAANTQEPRRGGAVRLIHVGRMLDFKRVPGLVSAMFRSRERNWTLDLVGDGPERDRTERLVRKLGLTDRVNFLGNLPNQETLALIARSDALVLASRWDGWGVVVNEALMLGVRVVCSSQAGAADLVVSREHGRVFEASSIDAMQQAIDATVAEGPTTSAVRAALVQWSQRITAGRAAGYLADILQHAQGRGPRPVPPWSVS
jgi:glycosyltransferase involved in cell wall biosynthesis